MAGSLSGQGGQGFPTVDEQRCGGFMVCCVKKEELRVSRTQPSSDVSVYQVVSRKWLFFLFVDVMVMSYGMNGRLLLGVVVS